MSASEGPEFKQLALSRPVLKGLEHVGYETPSPIQAETIPLLLEGRDVLGQAQTGTGKTAAFALPILSRLDLRRKDPQTLVLAPTRELAIQVAEAFKTYASELKSFHVLPVYGGQDYRGQIRALERGVHVVVGTPGRVMDHMRRGTLKLDSLTTLVLDEADEMLRMGFIDDVEWILQQTPSDRQIALFSATIPSQIRRIASNHLNDPAQITIKVKTTTAETIRQRYWPVSGRNKLDTLTRILEAETFDGMIVFVRTKQAAVEVAEKLEARGYAAEALNGDIVQKQRERTVAQLRNGKLDILVATDVAARGLDVERISHVINYDVPHDTESYVHRIGRTGRAGREGEAILFITPREMRLLRTIEKATRQKIEKMALPSNDSINERRISRFKQRITDTLDNEDLKLFSKLVEEYCKEQGSDIVLVAAALAQQLQGDAPFLLEKKQELVEEKKAFESHGSDQDRHRDRKGGRSCLTDKSRREKGASRDEQSERPDRNKGVEKGFERFRVEVGHNHRVKPGNIVGAIANEADLESRYIGRINIFDDHSTVDLPEGMPKAIFKKLKTVWVAGRQLKIVKYGGNSGGNPSYAGKPRGSKSNTDGKNDAKSHKKAAGKKPADKKHAAKKSAGDKNLAKRKSQGK